MNILFISRAYPPVTGGIENQNYALSVYLAKHAQVTTIANRRGRGFLPFFLPYALFRAIGSARHYDVILLGDGVLGIVGYFAKLFTRTPVVSVLHGLDINYNSNSLNVWYERILITLYQKLWVGIFLPALDAYIVVSNETRMTALHHGLLEKKISVIPNGVAIPEEEESFSRKDLEQLLKRDLSDTVTLLTAGRLVKRKGVAWFIRDVLPRFPASQKVLYVIAGSGPDKENIERAVTESRLEERVITLGRVSDHDRDLLLHTADIFVQPNIKVSGDQEGFGLTVLEAAIAKRPLVVSDLEGLKDAIMHNENGLLVPPENPEAFVTTLLTLFASAEKRALLGERAFRYTREHYNWDAIAKKYVQNLADRIGGHTV